MGYTSSKGNEFNVLTIRNMLENPKYKGWYCGNKTQSLDYRTKKKAFLEESEWIMYPDPSIPAIVPEELWNRANALYKTRSEQMVRHQSAAEFHNRYAYSGKLICEEHGTSFHRQALKSAKGEKEVWQCRVYRQRGRAACSAPQLRTDELNEVMARIFTELIQNKQAVIDAVVSVIERVPQEHDYTHDVERLEGDIAQLAAKKDRLLEISMEGAISISEFKKRNDGFNEQLTALKEKMEAIRQEQAEAAAADNLVAIKAALQQELDFTDGISADLVTTILDHIVVKKGSTKEEVHLDIYLKVNGLYEAVLLRKTNMRQFLASEAATGIDAQKSSFCISRSRNTTPNAGTWTTWCP
jgi:hypothetical protein